MFARRYVLVAAAAAFALLGSGCAEVTSGTPGSSLSMAGFVQAGAKATLSQKTAKFTVSGAFGIADQSVSVTGSGGMDFTGHAMRLDMHMKIAGQSAVISEIMTNGSIYMSLNAGGTSMKDLVGKDWGEISIPGGVQAGSSSNSSNPLAMLKYMSDAGATVTPLGTATIRGIATKGYSVTIPASVLRSEAIKELNSDPSISADDRARIQAGLQSLKAMTMQVWFDPSKNLMERMRVNMSLSVGASGMTGTMTFDFTDYGTDLTIKAPPANDVAPFPTH